MELPAGRQGSFPGLFPQVTAWYCVGILRSLNLNVLICNKGGFVFVQDGL